MNNEIKEILDNLKNKDNDIKGINFLKYQDLTRGEINLLLDYITNLQQAIEVKNERIKEEQQEKERYIKFYNELNIWNKELQQENERLQENNQAMQEEMARVWEENERLKEEHNQLRNCRKYDLNLISNLKHDKVRYEEIIDKAIEYIKEHNPSDIGICGNEKKYYYTLDKDSVDNLLNILQNGSDEE